MLLASNREQFVGGVCRQTLLHFNVRLMSTALTISYHLVSNNSLLLCIFPL